MDVRLKPFDFANAAARAGLGTDGLPLVAHFRKRDRKPPERVNLAAEGIGKSNDQIEAAVAFKYLTGLTSAHGNRDDLLHIVHGEAVAGDRGPVDVHCHDRQPLGLFGFGVGRTGDALEHREYLLGLIDYRGNSCARAGIEVVPPGGAFYLFPRSPFPDEMEFLAAAREEGILVVPGSGFGRAGHFRLAYCVSPEMVRRSVPAWERLGARLPGRKGRG